MFENMDYRDFNRYLNNKKVYETSDPNSEAALSAATQNQALRDKYKITGDNYSYNDLYTYGGNKYSGAADKSMAALGNYSRFKDPYNRGDLRRKLENFNYNPETDPNFQSYKDMYARQGQAAQGQTLANLTALSGGRNNSWASTAAAQVGQAYAQKTSDMIPVLAQQAYDKLLQRYNIEAQESDRAYGRWIDQYGRARDMADLYNTLGQQELQNRRQQLMDNDYYRFRDKEYGMLDFEDALNRMYAEDERRAALEGQLLGNQYTTKQINWYDPQQQAAYEAQQLQNKLYGKEYDWYDKKAAADIAATNRRYRGGSGGGRNKTMLKELGKMTVDEQLSNFLYSAADYTGENIWSKAWEKQEINPAYAAMTKLQDAQVVKDLKETLITNGYTAAQANKWIKNAKEQAAYEVAYADSLKTPTY